MFATKSSILAILSAVLMMLPSVWIGSISLLAMLVGFFESPAWAGGWEHINTKKGVKVFSKEVEGSPLLAFKGVTTVDAPLQKVLFVIATNERRQEWVDRLYINKQIETVSPFEYTVYQAFKLYYFGDESPADWSQQRIGEFLGLPVSQVNNYVYKARQFFGQRLRDAICDYTASDEALEQELAELSRMIEGPRLEGAPPSSLGL